MDLKLTVTCEVEGQEKNYDLEFSRELITIGRHSLNDVQIPDMQVSAEHARILIEDDQAYLIDLGSTIGTEVNGEPTGPHQRVRLSPGDRIQIGTYRLEVAKPEVALDESTSEKTAMVAMRMVKEVLGSLSSDEKKEEGEEQPPRLEVTNDAEAGTVLTLDETREYRVGRDKASDLVLKHWSISRRHALFRRDGDGVSIMDMGSKNGVMVNGERVTDSRRLKDSDVVAVGHTEIRFLNPSRGLLDSMDASPTPMTDLGALGVSHPVPAAKSPAAPASPPPETSHRPEPRPEPRPAPSTPHSPAPGGSPAGYRRPIEPESSLGDYLPMIVGGVLIVGAILAFIFLFLLKG